MTDAAPTMTSSQHSITSPARREIAGIVARLLLHYWAGELSERARQAMAADWLEDLAEFQPSVVEWACREWRQKPGRIRPGSGDIRELCIAEENRREAHNRIEHKPHYSADEVARIADEWAREGGYANIDAFQRAGRSLVVRVNGRDYRFAPIVGKP